MLRVTFLASDAKSLQQVITGLSALSEQRGADEGDTFTLYNVTAMQTSKDTTFAVGSVEMTQRGRHGVLQQN